MHTDVEDVAAAAAVADNGNGHTFEHNPIERIRKLIMAHDLATEKELKMYDLAQIWFNNILTPSWLKSKGIKTRSKSPERAKRLEKLLDTPARIYYQGVSPVGSDKPNIVVPRVWYYAQQGVKNFVTEIGVGPRGSSFAFACSLFGLNCISRWNCSIEDLNEYEAIICCFGENSKMKINSTKSMLGHLVGASGVVKAVATIKVTDKLYEWVDLSVL
ncbi:tryptophan synthase [Tanacetum coccineum]